MIIERRDTMLDVVSRVAAVTTVPLTVGGGISDLRSADRVLKPEADKISVSSAAFRKPELVKEMVKTLGPEKVTVAIDVDRNAAMPSGHEVYIKADGRRPRRMRSNGPSEWKAMGLRSFCRPAKRATACIRVMICR